MSDTPKDKPVAGEGEISPWALAGLGAQFAAGIVVGLYGGQWLDRKLGTAPVFLFTLALVLGGGVFVVSYRRLMARSRRPRTGSAAKPGSK